MLGRTTLQTFEPSAATMDHEAEGGQAAPDAQRSPTSDCSDSLVH